VELLHLTILFEPVLKVNGSRGGLKVFNGCGEIVTVNHLNNS
jgi:hypothetical protein